jgi:hypothetical protein
LIEYCNQINPTARSFAARLGINHSIGNAVLALNIAANGISQILAKTRLTHLPTQCGFKAIRGLANAGCNCFLCNAAFGFHRLLQIPVDVNSKVHDLLKVLYAALMAA